MARSIPTRKKPTTVWLENDFTTQGKDKQKAFRCFNCGMHVLKYRGDVLQIVPGGVPYTSGTEVECTGSVRNNDGVWEECGYTYIFLGVATPILN